MPSVSPGRFLVLTGLLLLSGCGNLDPYLRDNVWKPTGANAGNLAAMVANPNDLIAGRHTAVTNTRASTIAIQHVWDDQPKSLSSGGSGGGSASSGSGGGGSAGSASPGG